MLGRGELQSCDRIDISWDSYRSGSTKECTREKWGEKNSQKRKQPCQSSRNFPDFFSRHYKLFPLAKWSTCGGKYVV